MKFKVFIVILVAVVGALALSNPDMQDFAVYAEDRSAELLEAELGGGALGNALSQFGSSLAGSYIDRITERANYVLWSTYTIGDEEEQQAWKFLGVAGQFFQIAHPERQDDSS